MVLGDGSIDKWHRDAADGGVIGKKDSGRKGKHSNEKDALAK
jgi:hypothetical protein